MSQIWENTPVEQLKHPKLSSFGVNVFIKRDDLMHPHISGNKWRKLKYNMEYVKQQHLAGIVTFGGAYSNHLVASAAAASLSGVKSVGLVRGEYHPENPTLQLAAQFGMQLRYISRAEYANKNNPDYISSLAQLWPNHYCIPEGGANALGIKGCKEILSHDTLVYDYVAVAVGTATTLRGLLRANKVKTTKILGIAVLKGFEKLEKALAEELQIGNGEFNHNYHFGGYVKFNASLINFINEFKISTSIALDPIYTGKMMYAVFDLIERGQIKKGSNVLTIHTGGLQGIEGFNQRFGSLIL